MKYLIDMDGILCDFVGGMCKAHGIENPYLGRKQYSYDVVKETGIPKQEFWKPCDSKDFWVNLEPLKSGIQLMDHLLENSIENICLLSSPTLGDGCMPGKQAWIQKHLPAFSRRFLFGSVKEFCANGNNAMLIDDWESNCDKFEKAGGWALLWPAPWNHRWNVDFEYIIKEYL